MNLHQRLDELGINLPAAAPAPLGTYVSGVTIGNLLFMSGCGPRRPDGGWVTGKLGADMSIEQGSQAARLVAINMLAGVRATLGSLDAVERVVKTLGMVNCTPDFKDMPKVVNGFSDLFVELLGPERGTGARSAVGMCALPGGIPVEVEMVLQIDPSRVAQTPR